MISLPDLTELLTSIPALLIAITIHEFSHGYVAYRLGDPTAKMVGRLSLNPLKHLDPIGAIMLLVFKFGWAKPVPINPRNFENPQKGMVLSSIGGPLANLIVAALFALPVRLAPFSEKLSMVLYQYPWLTRFMIMVILYNIVLAVFNMIPIPPLDGSKILAGLLPAHLRLRYLEIERYGFLILIVLIYFNIIDRILFPLANLVSWFILGTRIF